MIKLGDLIQEIKVIPARSGLVYWPDLRDNLRKEFKRGYKIYNNLSFFFRFCHGIYKLVYFIFYVLF